MRVQDLIKRKGHDVIVISSAATVAELLSLMTSHNIGSVVVVDDEQVRGIVSERDIVREMDTATDDIRTHPVSSIMTDVLVCHMDDDTADLAATMTEHRIRHLPVTDDDGNLLAIVSIGDVVKARLDTLRDERDHLINYVQQEPASRFISD